MGLEKTMEALKKRGYAVSFFKTGAEAADYVCENVKDTVVGMGGSITIGQLGLYDRLLETNTVYWHGRDKGPDVRRHGAFDTKVYITSMNGVSENGEMVNLDGGGNRISGMLYGKERVYIIVGKNKITPDLDSAIWRTRNIASPINAQRLGRKTPCAAKADKCYDCNSPERICRALAILLAPTSGIGKTEVILVDEDLGA